MYLDLVIFNVINGFAGKWQFLDWAAIFFAVYSGYVLLGILCIFLVKNFKKNWRMVTEAFIAAIIVRFVLVQIFYWLLFRARPFVNSTAHLLVDYNAAATSFPSGHASFYFALSTIVFAYHKKTGTVFYVCSILMVVSRVFVGVHWPSDILAGAVLGIVMGILLNRIFRKLTYIHTTRRGYYR